LPIIDPDNVALLRPLARPEGTANRSITDLAFSQSGQLAGAISCDQEIMLWDAESSLPLPVPEAGVSATCEGSWKLAFSPAGYLLASTANDPDSQNLVELWTVSGSFGAQPLQTLQAGPKPVTGLDFSPDGRILAAGTQENTVHLWFISDPADPLATPITEIGILPLSDWAVDVDFSPDGRWLAAGSAERRGDRFEPVVHLWRVQDLLKAGAGQASVFATLAARSGPLREVGFSPDGRLLVAAGAGLTLWEPEGEPGGSDQESEEVATEGWIERAFLDVPAGNLEFSPSGALLAAGGEELWIWDLADGLPSGENTIQVDISTGQAGGELLSLVFSPAGQALATLSVEGMVTIWGIHP
jgi:WD40 repeat protein